MFVIIQNDSVIWGPKKWNKLTIENCLLDDCEVEFTVDSKNDGAIPVIVNDNIKILPIKVIDSEPFNPRTQIHHGPFWNFKDDVAEMYYVPQDLPLDAAKSFLKNQVSNKRWQKEISGITVPIQGQEIPISTQRGPDRQIYSDMAETLSDSNTVSWKFSNDVWLDLTKADLNSIVTAINNHVSFCFEWEKTKLDEINAVTELNQLLAIDIEN